MSDTSRRRVSYGQLESLCEFLNSHRDIATGFNKTSRARDTSKRMWENIAQSLNSHGDGAIKDWKGWSKYWNDYKCKLKKAVANIRNAQNGTSGGQSEERDLSDLEKRFLQILGDSFGSGLPGVRVEPFNTITEPAERNANIISEVEEVAEPLLTFDIFQPEPSGLPLPTPQGVLRPGPMELSIPAELPHTLRPSEVPPPAQSTQQEPIERRPSPQPSIQRPRDSTQRRRRRRAEPPMSQEVARRTLIELSRERNSNESARNSILLELVQELKEIKVLLQTRLPAPELPETPHLDLP